MIEMMGKEKKIKTVHIKLFLLVGPVVYGLLLALLMYLILPWERFSILGGLMLSLIHI